MRKVVFTILEVACICIPLFVSFLYLFRSEEKYKDKYASSKFKFLGIKYGKYKLTFRLVGVFFFVLACFLFWRFYIAEPDPENAESREFLEEINKKDEKLDKLFSMSFSLLAAIAIPARMGSTRFPGKPLAKLGGKRVIERVWESCKKSKLADKVVILTDSSEISDFAKSIGADCSMTSPNCSSGTERIVEAIGELGADFVVNVQGDEPFVSPDLIDCIISRRKDANSELVTAVSKIEDPELLKNPNVVKVLRDGSGDAIYFSRSPLPFVRGTEDLSEWLKRTSYWRHIGIYGYSAKSIALYSELPVPEMEKCEMLEQLRFVAAGKKFDVVETSHSSIGIDTEDDLKKAEEFLRTLEGQI